MVKLVRTTWLVGVGAAWMYEAFSITTRRTPTITEMVQANYHRRAVPPATVAGCLSIAAVAIRHLSNVPRLVAAEVSSAA
jgi:hypothetical protein